MKWLLSNGKELVVREVSAPLFRLQAQEVPIPIVNEILSDTEARERVREMVALKIYKVGKP